MSTSGLPFADNLGLDPAATGDPFVRVRFRHGMLLSAEDLTLEQRSHLLRHRVHQALLHGAGTIWGLGARFEVEDGRPELKVGAGLAIDALGREIFVPTELCLDLSTLSYAHFASFAEVGGPGRRRACIVLRHETAETEPVPALRPFDPSDPLTTSRVCDRFRVDLQAEAPPDPSELLLGWLGRDRSTRAVETLGSLRDALIAWITGPAEDLARIWDPEAERDAPLLLATVELDAELGAGTTLRLRSATLDNRVRALCPALPLMLDQLLGQRMAGWDGGEGCRVRAIEVNSRTGRRGVDVAFTAPVEPGSLGGVRMLALGTAGWVRTTLLAERSADGATLRLSPAEPPAEGARVQVLLPGQAEAPVLGQDGQPLAGWWDDPLPARGRGMDVSWIGAWAEVGS